MGQEKSRWGKCKIKVRKQTMLVMPELPHKPDSHR